MFDSRYAAKQVKVITPSMKRLDAYSATEFKRSVEKELQDGIDLVVLDLSLVDFMDSSGLTSLVTIYKKITCNLDGKMALSGLNDMLIGLMKLTKLDLAIESYPTKEEATAALQKR